MERNYKEDQQNEIEALDSIYCGDMEIVTTEPFHQFKIPIATEGYSDEEQNGIKVHLIFTFTEKYPDEAPDVDIDDSINLEEESHQKLLNNISDTIKENIGMEMIFTLVSTAQEWINVRWDELKKEEDMERQRKVQEQEELERKKFEGTRVTVESFMKWKLNFEEEMGISLKREKANSDAKKLTGKELFLRDNTLNESDIKFLLEAGDSIENVRIDESLFQNIEDLEFESEDEDDEDYVPGKDS
ncbi:RWD domain-containing protein 1 [Condylostylus longicornis]|uniref:RWD domain-containing protein 1 n=1 Tax=Condylostylus longicornis TaxID=2530218 RepID=UPI00244DB99B|nr:RWD domain-containing protein 1 [Condylostylus longicornis]